MNEEQIIFGVQNILLGLGLDLKDQHLVDTPKRVAKAYLEMFEGLRMEPPILRIFEGAEVDQMIVSDNIPFYSFCSHHFLPFRGVAKIAYIPNEGRIVGLSKLARVLDYFSKRPSVQELITNQVADFLYLSELNPAGVGVILKASHDCMCIRGVKKEGSIMKTSALRGVFEKENVKQEFINL